MARILVPDYPGQQVIAGVRELYRIGDQCDLAWDLKSINYLFKSRYIFDYKRIPKPNENADAYIHAVLKVLSQADYDLLLPFGNSAYHAICLAQDEIKKHTHIFVPGKESHQIAYDKSLTFKHCQKIGIPVPQTFFGFAREDLYGIANAVQFPVVIKTKSGSGVKSGLRYANSVDELIEWYDELNAMNESAAHPFDAIIQEFIPGYIHDACTVSTDGTVLQTLTQVRHWMYPITGGVGAVNYTTKNETVKRQAEQVLESLSWSGPAQIEFKYDERDQKYKLIEINSKFWGTLDLSIQSGVNFPLIVRDFVLENRIPRVDYEPDNFYFFYFPQATLAGLQNLRKFGPNSLKINKPVRRKFSDIDFSDLKPVIYRILKTMGDIVLGKTANRSLNLEKSHINH